MYMTMYACVWYVCVCAGEQRLNSLSKLITNRAEIELPLMAAQLRPGLLLIPPPTLIRISISISLSKASLTVHVKYTPWNRAIRKCEWETLLMMIDLGKHQNIRIQILLPAIRSASSWL